MNLTRLLIPAALMLVAPVTPRAYCDVVITDPATGPTTATIDGVPADVEAALSISLSAYPAGNVMRYSVHPDVGDNGHGPVWVSGNVDLSLWCGWGGCVVGRLGWDGDGGPLDPDQAFGGLDLNPYIGNNVIVTATPAATEFRIVTPPASLIDIIADWFANPSRTVGQLFAALERWFMG